MARELKQISHLIDHTGAYFCEKMWQIVSILCKFLYLNQYVPIIARLISYSLISWSTYFYTLIYQVFLFLQGFSADLLTPSELLVVLHAAETHLGWTISDEEIREGKLPKLLPIEDFDIPAQVGIYYSYLSCPFLYPPLPLTLGLSAFSTLCYLFPTHSTV